MDNRNQRQLRGNAHAAHEIRLALDRQTRNQGKWLSLIVQVLAMQSPPDDPRIAELTARVKAAADALENADLDPDAE